MGTFSKLERDILATLEEVGEDHLAALLNTVRECRGSRDEIDALRTALTALIDGDFIAIAGSRDEGSRHWIPLPKMESLSLLAELDALVEWSSTDEPWKWTSPDPRLEVILTKAGLTAAREILSKHGWPQEKAPWAADSH